MQFNFTHVIILVTLLLIFWQNLCANASDVVQNVIEKDDDLKNEIEVSLSDKTNQISKEENNMDCRLLPKTEDVFISAKWINTAEWKRNEVHIDEWLKFQSEINAERNWELEIEIKDKEILKTYLKKNGVRITEYEILLTSKIPNDWIEKGEFVVKPSEGARCSGIYTFQKINESELWLVTPLFEHEDIIYTRQENELEEFIIKNKGKSNLIIEEMIPNDYLYDIQSKIKLPFEIRTNVMYGKTMVMWIDDEEKSQLWRCDGYEILSKNLETHLSQMKTKINYQNIITKNEEISKIVGMFYGRIDWFVFETNGELQYIVNEVQPYGVNPIAIPYHMAYWGSTDLPHNKRWILNIDEFYELFQNEHIGFGIGNFGGDEGPKWWFRTGINGKKVKDETIQNFKNNKKIQEKIWLKFSTIKQDAGDEKLREFLSDFLLWAIMDCKGFTEFEKYLFETYDN